MKSRSESDHILRLLAKAKRIAREYREVTGRPLGIAGEVAEYEAASILGLQLADARQAGYDAIWRRRGRKDRVQIKGRCTLDGSKRSQRVGSIGLSKDWDVVLLVLMDGNFDTLEIHEAGREAIEKALSAPGSKARNERGSLAVSKFKSLGRKIWPKP